MLDVSEESGSGSDSEVELADVADVNKLKLKPKVIIPVNNLAGLKQKLQDIKLKLKWLEKLDVSVETDHENKKKEKQGSSTKPLEDKAEHDFNREMDFINQAKTAATDALDRLKKLGIPTKRPSDYFAEMAKSDEHMTKVRQKLMSKEVAIERSEKIRQHREQRKNAKQVQREILAKKRSEKKSMMEALKKSKKGKFDVNQILEEKKQQQQQRPPNKRNEKNQPSKDKRMKRRGKKFREYKNDKYGYGGQKKRSKYNTSDSAAVLPGMENKKFSGGKFKGKRPMQHGKRPRAKSTRRRR